MFHKLDMELSAECPKQDADVARASRELWAVDRAVPRAVPVQPRARRLRASVPPLSLREPVCPARAWPAEVFQLGFSKANQRAKEKKQENSMLRGLLMVINIVTGRITPNRAWDCKSPISKVLYWGTPVPGWVGEGL